MTITNIDKEGPAITIAPYMTGMTNQDITVMASISEGTLNTPSHTFTGNGSFDFIAKDALGNITIRTVRIDNIDKENPVITISPYSTGLINQDVTVTASTNEGRLNAT